MSLKSRQLQLSLFATVWCSTYEAFHFILMKLCFVYDYTDFIQMNITVIHCSKKTIKLKLCRYVICNPAENCLLFDLRSNI